MKEYEHPRPAASTVICRHPKSRSVSDVAASLFEDPASHIAPVPQLRNAIRGFERVAW